MNKKLIGECMCGTVTFSVHDDFQAFYQCHCKQCQQLTGSAYASNIFTNPENIEWLQGIESISTYEHSSRSFSNAFCQKCGSSLPFITKSGNSLIVPAGSLSTQPSIKLTAEIFCSERAWWSESSSQAVKHDQFPE